MSPQALSIFLYKIGAIQFGDFTFKSGRKSSNYVNLRKIISFPDVLRDIANLMWEKARTIEYDLVCGVPYTALPIATIYSLLSNVPMVMRRKEKKEYGTKQMIEGVYQTGQSCLVIEDVITTGASIMETTKELADVGLVVHDVIAVIDREEGGKAALSKHYRVQALITLTELFNHLLKAAPLTETDRELIHASLSQKLS